MRLKHHEAALERERARERSGTGQSGPAYIKSMRRRRDRRRRGGLALALLVAIGVLVWREGLPAYFERQRAEMETYAAKVLTTTALAQEEHRRNFGSYTSDVSELTQSTARLKLERPEERAVWPDGGLPQTGSYRFAVSLGNDGYVLTATPLAPSRSDLHLLRDPRGLRRVRGRPAEVEDPVVE